MTTTTNSLFGKEYITSSSPTSTEPVTLNTKFIHVSFKSVYGRAGLYPTNTLGKEVLKSLNKHSFDAFDLRNLIEMGYEIIGTSGKRIEL